MYFYLKSIHIIFIITWFAGLFYTPRLFVYIAETFKKNDPEKSILLDQFKIMTNRLWYGISWPSAIITIIIGPWLMFTKYTTIEFIPFWLWLKLIFVMGVYIYHLFCHKIVLQIKKDQFNYSSMQMRFWNEVSTILLVAIVFLVVLQDSLSFIWGILGFIAFTIFIILGIFIYKKVRKK